MRTSTLATSLLTASAALAQSQSQSPGSTCFPDCIEPTIPRSNDTFNFGSNYAVLNLDMITGLIAGIADTPEAQSWIDSTSRWIDAVHAKSPMPLSLWTRIYFANADKPEVGPSSPFAAVASSLQPGTQDDNNTMIYPAFEVAEEDVVLQKFRYYAGWENALETILRAQQIDTVVLSGIRTSGVILNTAYRLFNLDYTVYVVANNTIETPPDSPGINAAILEGIIPKLPADVITLDQALCALERSG
ncbi:hypothetical protein MBLNU230_g1751t1 [Neophaeotheca triangularis]